MTPHTLTERGITMWHRWITARRRENLYRTGILDTTALPALPAVITPPAGSSGAA